MLSSETLAALLPSKTLNQSLFVFKELASTNTFALELAKKPISQGTVVLADSQTAGRGRLQRSWFSPPGANLYGSLLFSFNNAQFQTTGWIPLMAGIAIAKAIEDHAEIGITLKWPNDILIDERKVGGILCETFKKSPTETCVVIGFGINVNLSESAFPKDLELIATSLQIQAQRHLERHHLLKSIITTLEKGWEALISEGPQTCRLAYSTRCSTLGKEIQVQFPDGSKLRGMAQSIGKQGQLQMLHSPSDAEEQSDRILDVHAGDICHIRKSDFQ